jgi:hypothetical protein
MYGPVHVRSLSGAMRLAATSFYSYSRWRTSVMQEVPLISVARDKWQERPTGKPVLFLIGRHLDSFLSAWWVRWIIFLGAKQRGQIGNLAVPGKRIYHMWRHCTPIWHSTILVAAIQLTVPILCTTAPIAVLSKSGVCHAECQEELRCLNCLYCT